MPLKRVWYAWTARDQADAYQQYLDSEVIPAIAARALPGFHGIEILRDDLDQETEFVVIMTFEDLDAVIAFRGEDYIPAYVPAQDKVFLSRWNDTARHYHIAIGRLAD